MSDRARAHLERAKHYLRLLEQSSPSPDLAQLFSPHFVHREFPNLLNPRGRTLSRDELVETARKAKAIVADERYEVRGALACEDSVALEVDWQGTLRTRFGKVEPGTLMRASFAVFLGFEGDEIVSQRNYDCFEPF